MKYLQRLCDEFGVLPASFIITDRFSLNPFTVPPTGIYEEEFVVARVFNAMPVEGSGKLSKVSGLISEMIVQGTYVTFIQRFAREVVGWKWLRHENILPFIGVVSIPPRIPIAIVSTFGGSITGFMKANPEQNPFILVGILCFVSININPWCSLSMRPMAYNTCINMSSSMGTSKG